jgi:hypothetical protein
MNISEADQHLMKNSLYLGDGVYTHNDGYHLIIFTTDGVEILQKVYLDDYVKRSLYRLLKRELDNDEV